MSRTSRWAYTNTATIKPFERMESWSGEVIYGEPYEIACTWTAEAKQHRDGKGAEFVSTNVIFTEDTRPKYLDMIQLGGEGDFQEIRSVTNWDMSFFGETPDLKLVT